MDQEPDQLKHQIAQTRADMTNTIDAIGDHVSPGRIAERRKNQLVASISSARDRVMGTASSTSSSASGAAGNAVDAAKGLPDTVTRQTQGSPLGAGLVAFGLGFVAAAVFPASSKEKQLTGQLMESAQPLADELADQGKDIVDHLKQPAQEAVEEVKAAAGDATQEVRASATGAVEATKQQVRPGDPPPSGGVTGDPLR